MEMGDREGKKPRRQDLSSSWAQQGAGKKESEARGTYYPEPGVASNCKQTLPTPLQMSDGLLACDLAWQSPPGLRAAIRRCVMSGVMGKARLQMAQMEQPHKMTHCESSLKSPL